MSYVGSPREWGLAPVIGQLALSLSISPLSEHPARRHSSANPDEHFHQKPNPMATWFWTSQPLELRKINFCCLIHPVNNIFVITA